MRVQQALEIVSLTDSGLVRSHNEDTVAELRAYGLAVLADGMGGYNAGEVASGIATSVILSEVEGRLSKASPALADPKSGRELGNLLIERAIRKSNASIFQAAQSQPQYSGMGTTIVTALFYDNRAIVAHVGDSRLYRLRDGELKTVTKDHSLLQEQLDSGMITAEEARWSKNKNLVTRALGVELEVEPEVQEISVKQGDVYLLCSDGLNDMVPDDEIREAVYAMQANLSLAAQQLVQMANDYGGRDNISVILVKVNADFSAKLSWWGCFCDWLKGLRS